MQGWRDDDDAAYCSQIDPWNWQIRLDRTGVLELIEVAKCQKGATILCRWKGY